MPEIVDPRVDPALVPQGSVARVINGPNNEYQDLPAIQTPTGRVITRWALSKEERMAVLRGEDIFVTLLTAGKINPFFVTIGTIDWNAP